MVGLPTIVVTHQLQVERGTEKVSRPATDVLPLCHATNATQSTVTIAFRCMYEGMHVRIYDGP